jgi:hypothetical protein
MELLLPLSELDSSSVDDEPPSDVVSDGSAAEVVVDVDSVDVLVVEDVVLLVVDWVAATDDECAARRSPRLMLHRTNCGLASMDGSQVVSLGQHASSTPSWRFVHETAPLSPQADSWST